MQAKDVMVREIATIAPDASLLDAVKLMVNAGAGALPVVDEGGTLVGLVTEFDLIRHVLGSDETLADFQAQLAGDGALADAYARVLARPVIEIMTREVITAAEDADLHVVAGLILEHRARSIPIVHEGSLVGLVSRADLVKALLSRPAAGTTTAPPAAAVDDDQLRHDVTAAVRKVGVPLGGSFDVVVQHGIVHLWGEVFDELAHQSCRTAAAEVAGVVDVYNHMQIVPASRRQLRWRR